MNEMPLVSIVITSYNRGNLIGAAIQSSLDQDYPNIEIIISDNVSTDNSDEVIKKYVADKRVKYFVNDTNIGMVPNFKLATEQRATGKYITYVSNDDYLSNNSFISKAVSLINKYPDIVIVAAKNYTLYEDINEVVENNDSDYIYEDEFKTGTEVFQSCPKSFLPSFSGVIMHREKLIDTRTFESKAISLDVEVNLKLMLLGNVAFIKEPVYVWRKHSSQASGSKNLEGQINELEFIENTYKFAKKRNVAIDLEKWRQEAYFSHLNGTARRMIDRKDELNQLINHIKVQKKVRLSFLRSPRFYVLLKIYKNYDKISFLLKRFYPGLYQSIEKDK
jgi:glycosyltransferase involved in cell wall biosynthesis